MRPSATRYTVSRSSASTSSSLVAVAIPSHDLDAARRFYQDALGMQVAAGGQVRGAQVCACLEATSVCGLKLLVYAALSF
jgi:hypothetical protein